MKIVIDISEEEYVSCKKHFENLGKREVINDYEYAIANGTPLPENATNGDVIKAMFGEPYKISERSGVLYKVSDFVSYIGYDWWNAQYEGGKEERCTRNI